MDMGVQAAPDRAAKNSKPSRSFYPSATMRCEGSRVFRSQAARDLACLLDVDPYVVLWRCAAPLDGTEHTPDFEVVYDDGRVSLLDAHDREIAADQAAIEVAARRHGAVYRQMLYDDVHGGFRLKNAKDLLRYGNYVVPLGDRIRLLGALDANGSMPIVECLNAFQEVKPVAGLASLVLNRYVEVDLDDAPLGPETAVRRIAR